MTDRLEGAVDVLERVADDADAAGNQSIQRALAAVVRLYAARAEIDRDLRPLSSGAPWLAPTATETLIAVGDLLDAAGLEVFELGLWKTMGRVRP
ncbi:MAG: hypothetical protein ACRDLP_05465 [Solirubrobacteraceae bacterium]